MIKISAMDPYSGPLDEVWVPIIRPTEVGDNPWANFRMLASDLQGDGGDSTLTFENGLTKTAYDVVKLGGPLTGDTEIDANGHSLSLTNLNEGTTGHVVYIDDTTGELTKGPATEAETVTADNGLTKTAYNVIELGGTPLYKDTNIDGASAFKLNLTNLRFQEDLGTSIAAANNLTLGLDGNSFTVTGNTQINAITSTDWQAGSVIRLIFTGTPIVKHNTAGGGGTAPILLSGAIDYTAAANDVLTMVYNGTNWHETSRIMGATGAVYTVNNGLTASTPNNFQLGGTLLQHTTINTAGFRTIITGSNTNFSILDLTNTGAASAGTRGLTAVTTDGTTIHSTATNGIAGDFYSTSSFGIRATSVVNPAEFVRNTTGTNQVVPNTSIKAITSSGTVANGFGTSLDFSLEDAGGGANTSNRIVSTWTTAANATRTASLEIWGTNSGTSAKKATVYGNGDIEVHTIGAGLIVASPDGTRYKATMNNGGTWNIATA
jgi:hypothetical protein